MLTPHTETVATHYTRRHAIRGDLFGEQPFANYGYWTRDGLSMVQAAEALTRLVAASAGLARGDRLLDVGCGYGAGAVVFARAFDVDAITGIDVTPVRIDEGRRYVAAQGYAERIDLRLGDATRMEFADGSFDKLVSVECAFHFDTRVDFLREAARVLRPGGTLALTDLIPRRGVDPTVYQRGVNAVGSEVCLDNVANTYDADVYAAHLRAAGFESVRIESILESTRIPFVDALQRAGERDSSERGAQMLRSVARQREILAGGEDYVLVVARKSG
ncbi:MAG TPA: class I SAM-dependent methyltransferase [Solimonas sp.]|nr:class I SAM-dependent methyltransferase [Solimonas sp.]